MKLKTFNAGNTHSQRASRTDAMISIDRKSGLFRINKPGCELLGVKKNHEIEFLQDEDKPDSWYLHLVKGQGFSLREKPDSVPGLFFNNTQMAKLIFDSVPGYKGKGARLLIGGKALKLQQKMLWPLDLSQLKAEK